MIRMKKGFWCAAGLALLLLGACQINDVKCDKECMDGWMDYGGSFRDSCAEDTNTHCLVSKRLSAPTSADLGKPVIIAVHGFTASTYEWEEFRNFAEDTAKSNPGALVSLVLLGGHGRDIDSFQSSTWRDWGRPILSEYDSLVAKHFSNISFAASSTGAALLMQFIADGAFDSRPAPNRIYLIDPIVVPTSKILSLVDLVGPILGNSPNPGDSVENRHWYVNRPEEDLKQLYDLINRVKNHLEDGFRLPKSTLAKVYKSKHDNSADPVSALLIYNGMRPSDGGRIDAELVDSRLHVFTRLQGRNSTPSHADSLLQQRAFQEMAAGVNQPRGVNQAWPRP